MTIPEQSATPNDMPESSGITQQVASEYLDHDPELGQVTAAATPVVVLVGPPGAGKSTIGRRLARALHTEVTDSDVLIEEAMGKSCGEVFTELGEPRFREVEAEYVAQALQTSGVVSLGGGAVLTGSTRDLLKHHNVVWIDVSPEEGARRTANESTRPVLAADDPAEHYRRLIETRRPLYREVSRFRARTDRRSPQKVVADILGFLESSD
ncbi:AAA family ATPase [Corynebacterium sp. SCR221107]|nr:shikimate kinase [Corynebacterium sp. SCR221107]WBT07786.1 AAA family ATPase [Corynebacterium sp. SCR221107]